MSVPASHRAGTRSRFEKRWRHAAHSWLRLDVTGIGWQIRHVVTVARRTITAHAQHSDGQTTDEDLLGLFEPRQPERPKK